LETAAWWGTRADGLITVNAPEPQLTAIIEAFRAHGGEGKPIYLQAHVSYAATDAEATAQAMAQWRTAVLPPGTGQELASPAQFDQLAPYVREEDLAKGVRMSADLGRHAAWLEADRELGFERVYLHNVGTNQDEFIDAFATSVLPRLT
jgi:alkanesulfonate monooxygenase SsuD/methylene tetrahydromethanopterin reductase-like flavin-dependent oxidoreductase (luciferase family)